MNGKLDWKGVGQFVAVLVRIWTIVKTVVNDGKVGLEMLDWIVGQGETFFTEWFATLVEEYKKSACVDFNVPPRCPYGLLIADDRWQIRSRVKGAVDVNGIETCLHTVERQVRYRAHPSGQILSHELAGKRVCGAQLLDFYLSHPEMIPGPIKEKLEEGVDVFFWGTIYVDHERHCVRFLRFERSMNRFVGGLMNLDALFGPNDPALVLAD